MVEERGASAAPPRAGRVPAQLLVGAAAFWRQAEHDIRAARRRVYIQAMTFEADCAGRAVAQAVRAATATDRRVLVDDFTRYVVSDRFVFGPRALLDPELRAEVRGTRRMFLDLQAAGVAVRVTNPIEGRISRLAFRNHKTLIVADGVAYIGGVNFSDHNFAWDDLMLRIEDDPIANRLATDFIDTCSCQSFGWVERFPGVDLHGLDGWDNARGFSELIAEIDRARTAISVVSPYLTFPFVAPLARAAARGVAVQLVTPLANNKPVVRDYLISAARKARIEVRLAPEMIHAKGMLIDGSTLVLGSSNFNFLSSAVEAEFMAVVRDAVLAETFRREVLESFLAQAVPTPQISAARSVVCGVALSLASDLICRFRPHGMPISRVYS